MILKSTDVRFIVLLLLLTLLAACEKDKPVVDGLAYRDVTGLSIEVSNTAKVGDSLEIRVKAVVDKHIFTMPYPNFPDTIPASVVDTMESLFVWIYQEPYSSSDTAGFSFRAPDTVLFTPVVDDLPYNFTFRADAIGAGQWWIVVAATYLDHGWQAIPERDGHDGYLDVWEAWFKVTIRSGE
jgi:hypothetical protein